MKCQFCGKEVAKVYECMFRDEPEDYGHILKVCRECIPEEAEEVFDEGNQL